MASDSTTDQIAATVAALLEQALSKLRPDDTGARVYPIDEAAARLNMSPRTLELWCRNHTVDHTKIGKFRGLTAEQIDRVAADHAVRSGAPARHDRDDELAAARAASAKAAARKPRRTAA